MSPSSSSASIEVLLVEDNPDDAWASMRALEKAKIRNRVHLVLDGEAARDFLLRRGGHAGAPVPDLILLDLNLPKLDGRTLLAEIKSDERFKHIPIVVVTGSPAEEDVARSYQLHANAYLRKPIDPAEFLHAVDAIEQFWLEIVKLP